MNENTTKLPLKEQIAQRLCATRFPFPWEWERMSEGDRDKFRAQADAVLALLISERRRGVVKHGNSWFAWVGDEKNLVGPYATEDQAREWLDAPLQSEDLVCKHCGDNDFIPRGERG
jgi:hypothetical protein